MSKLTIHEKKDNVKWWFAGIAIVLILAVLAWLIVAAVKDVNAVCLFKHNYGENNVCTRCGADKPVEPDDVSAGLFIDEDKIYGAENIMLLSTATSSAASGNSYTLRVVVDPVGSTDLFKWTISNNEDNAITLTVSDDGLSASVTCNKPFSIAKTVSVTSASNAAITKSAVIDYYKRIESIAVEASTLVLSTTKTNHTVNLIPTFSVGTITPTITVGNGTILCINDMATCETRYNGELISATAKVAIENGSYKLYMNADQSASFYSGYIGPMEAATAYFKMFLSTWSNLKNSGSTAKQYRISVDWTATVEGKGEVDSGTCIGEGMFDCSQITIPANGIELNTDKVIF